MNFDCYLKFINNKKIKINKIIEIFKLFVFNNFFLYYIIRCRSIGIGFNHFYLIV